MARCYSTRQEKYIYIEALFNETREIYIYRGVIQQDKKNIYIEALFNETRKI